MAIDDPLPKDLPTQLDTIASLGVKVWFSDETSVGTTLTEVPIEDGIVAMEYILQVMRERAQK